MLSGVSIDAVALLTLRSLSYKILAFIRLINMPESQSQAWLAVDPSVATGSRLQGSLRERQLKKRRL